MQRGRNTLILLVLAAAIGAYSYFVESKHTPASEAKSDAETRGKVFDKLDTTKIDDITVRGSAGETTHLKKAGNAWQIVEPTQSAVDDTEVSGLVSNLGTVEVSRVVEQDAKDLTKYGLVKPRIDVQFTAGDKTVHQLQIGSKTVTGGDLYAKLANEKKVILIPAYLESTFDRTTFQLRDKSILKFDRDKVDAVEVTTGGTTVKFAKQGEAWKMTAPVAARTDSTAVDTLIGRLATGQMKSLKATDVKPADLAQYGLNKPTAEVNLVAGSARSGFLVGGPADGTDIYAKDASRPMVFVVEKGIGDDLKKTAADFRTKDVFDARPFTTTHLDITRGGATTVFEKTKVPADKEQGKDDKGKGKDKPPVDKWTQTQPAPAKPIDASKIEDVVSKITGLRADSFVDKLPAGATELLTITTKFDDGKKSEKVVIQKAGSDYYAVRSDDAGAAKLPSSSVDDALKALDAAK
jgi:hypothetical protein